MHLLDGNVLVAVTVADHVHHEPARQWLGATRPFATCPSTQGTLLRLLLRFGVTTADAMTALRHITQRAGHEFWADDASYLQVPMAGVIGHRQITDAYLANHARRRGGRLATFDGGLAALHTDVVDLIET